jgi:hypothetical protein
MEIPAEYAFDIPVHRGAKGRAVRRIQEWLSLNGEQVAIDGSFGPATQAAVQAFQRRRGRGDDGIVDAATFSALHEPLSRALQPLGTTPEAFAKRVVAAARRHLKEHPREVGGQNAGPWVRLYTRGKEGPAWPWCAGFVTTMIRQAEEGGAPFPMKGSLSCDVLVAQAKKLDRFVSEADLRRDPALRSSMKDGAIFLVRNARNANDWIHTGIVTAFRDEVFETIEGNTNDAGDREGYEVCKRRRGYGGKDFILL